MYGGAIMPILLLIWNNKRWTLIIVLLLCLFFQAWHVNGLAGDLRKAETACDVRVAKAIKPYEDAIDKKKKKIVFKVYNRNVKY